MQKNLIRLMSTLLLGSLLSFSTNLDAKGMSRSKKSSKPKYEITQSTTFKDLPFNMINGKNRAGIISFIEQFPLANYKIYKTQFGTFHVDSIDDVIKDIIRNGVQWEPHIANLILKYARPGSVALDIGAHIGTHSIVMSRAVGPNGIVLAFEPQPKIFRELFLNMYLSNAKNIHFFYAGVSDQEGQIELTPLVLHNEGGTPLSKLGGTGIFAEPLTIDSLNLQDVSLMKIDVEGLEDQVLQGAQSTILRCKPVLLVEIMGGHNIKTAPPHIQNRIKHTMQIIRNLGYDVKNLCDHDYIAIPN